MPEQPFAHGIRKEKPRKIDNKLRFGMMWPNSPSSNVPSKIMSSLNADILDPQTHINLVKVAEEVGLDFVFFADGYTTHSPANAAAGHGEPRIMATVWAPVLMQGTDHIGIVTTMHARYLSPVVLARLGANLDVLSGGRWGWNIVPGSKGSEADLFGIELAEHDERYAEVEEVLSAVRMLWGAKGQPIYFDGKYSHHEGTPVGPSPMQAQPPIFNPGASPVARKFIARATDYAFFSMTDDKSQTKKTVELIAESCEEIGRNPLEVRAMGSSGFILAKTSQEAHDKHQWVLESVDLDAARGWAKEFIASSQTYQAALGTDPDAAARRAGASSGGAMFVGTPAEMADQIIDIHEQTGLIGFQLSPTRRGPDDVRLLGEVFPILEKKGIYEPPWKRGWSW
jgi:alkanesulfonate monooxygenase SsuD/methylene tetrahydromethanopterin reductase-like flavin-dependent oxidoreductase (luciferase family)